MRIRIVTLEKQRLWCKLHLTTSVVNNRKKSCVQTLLLPFAKAFPMYPTKRTEPDITASMRFLPLSSLFSRPLTIRHYLRLEVVKWPTRETDVLVEVASINFFAVVNDLKRRCKKSRMYLQLKREQGAIIYFSLSRDLSFLVFVSASATMPLIGGVVSTMTFKRDDRKGDSTNLSQVGRNISDTFNTRLSF